MHEFRLFWLQVSKAYSWQQVQDQGVHEEQDAEPGQPRSGDSKATALVPSH